MLVLVRVLVFVLVLRCAVLQGARQKAPRYQLGVFVLVRACVRVVLVFVYVCVCACVYVFVLVFVLVPVRVLMLLLRCAVPCFAVL